MDKVSRDDMGGYIVVVFKEGGIGYHHTVTKAGEMGRAHFLCKDTTWIELVRDVGDMGCS